MLAVAIGPHLDPIIDIALALRVASAPAEQRDALPEAAHAFADPDVSQTQPSDIHMDTRPALPIKLAFNMSDCRVALVPNLQRATGE